MFKTKKNFVLAIFTVFILLPGFVVFIYWKFISDEHPSEAIKYFEYKSRLSARDNAAYALDGLRAPLTEANFIQWSIGRAKYYSSISNSQYMDMQFENTSEFIAGNSPDPIPYNQYAEIYEPEEDLHFICWLPGATDQTDKCISVEEVNLVLTKNKIFLDRYSAALEFDEIDLNIGPPLHQYSIAITKLHIINSWKNRNSFSSSDLKEVSRLLWFWKTIADSQYFTSVDFAISLVNYGLALELFYQTASIYPEIINVYTKSFGKFNFVPVDQFLLDRIAIGEFFSLIPEMCIDRDFSYRKSKACKNLLDPIFKAGRTIKLMYQNKPILEDCKNNQKKYKSRPKISDVDFQLEILKRPGNYQGRIFALYMYADHYLICETLDSYRYKNELIGLFFLHNKLRSQNMTKSQIIERYWSNKEEFRILNSNRYYELNQENGKLVYVRPESDREVKYEM